MKGFLTFIVGFISGILATVFIAYVISESDKSTDDLEGLTLFPEKKECISTDFDLQIFSVIKPNMALVKTGDYLDPIVMLLINYDGKAYYDDQKISIPEEKCARHVGIYEYTTQLGTKKTVPAVIIE